MAFANVTGDRYTVESLYQWDKNQVLQINGLSLPKIPEIHFTTDVMDGAIVRQASMDAAGVVRVNVPNSLLQKPYTITAYVCIDGSGTFETLYKIRIPVVKRSKPNDYTFEDDAGEIYSFNELANMIANGLADIEAKRQNIAMEQTATGAVIKLIDKNGTQTVVLTNGKDGEDGEDGESGSADIISICDHEKVGDVHELTTDNLSGEILKFTATDDFVEGDTFTLNGESVGAVTYDGEDLPDGFFTAGAVIIACSDGHGTLFFRGGATRGESGQSLRVIAAPGSTVTISNGVVSKTGVSSGSVTFENLDLGTWTVKATLNGRTVTGSKELSIPEIALMYEVLLYDMEDNTEATGDWEIHTYAGYQLSEIVSTGVVNVKAQNGGVGVYVTRNTIDLTGFSKLQFMLSKGGTGNLYAVVMPVGATSLSDAAASVEVTTGGTNPTTLAELDLSSVSGEYQVGIGMKTNSGNILNAYMSYMKLE